MFSKLKRGSKKLSSGDDSPSPASENRRNQLRLAQRRHRTRKEAYVEALQREVSELRHRCRIVQQRNRNLQRYIQQHLGLNDDALEAICSGPAALSPSNHSPVNVQPIDDPTDPVYIARRNEDEVGMPYQLETRMPLLPVETEYQLGVNWVLSLERTCLAHIDLVADRHGSHSHQVTSQLIDVASIDITTNQPTPISDQDVSLSNLLHLSSSFALEGEITPVQAWFMLKEQGLGVEAGSQRLQMLQDKLLPGVKCLGFGAVIDQDLFAKVIAEAVAQKYHLHGIEARRRI